MRKLRAFLLRFSSLFSSASRDKEMADEIESNIQLHIDSNIAAGMNAEEARRAALLEFGGAVASKESYRSRSGLPFFETFFQDLRYAFRTFGKNKGFAAIAVLTLALGIGANTAMFSVVQAVLLRPLPYSQPDRLVQITETNPLKHWTNTVAAPANFADWKRMNTVFSGLAAYGFPHNVFLGGDGEPRLLTGLDVTGDLFDVLGIPAAMGRTFREEETFEGKNRVAMLSFDEWQSAFASDPGVVGRKIELNNKSYEIVGVMPRGFFFPDRKVGIFIPMGVPAKYFTEVRRPHQINTVARLRPGVALERAASQMKGIALQLERIYPDTNTKMGVRLDAYHDTLTSGKSESLLMLLAAVAGLYLIVCSNVANLQLGRAAARSREFGIRRALGAGRPRLIRQLLTESLLLSIVGGALGVALAAGARVALLHIAPRALPDFAELRMDSHVVLFSALLTLAAPLLFSMLPAFSSTRKEAMGDRSETNSPGTRRMRDLLVGCEVALSVILVAGAGLLIRSLIRLENVQPGFNAQHAVSFVLQLPQTRYPKDEQSVQTFHEIEKRLAALPGVETVGAASTLPLHGFSWTADATPEGRSGDDYERELRHEVATPGYFRAIGAPLLRGRFLNEFDTAKSQPVAVVNQALEQAYFRGQNSVGKRIKFGRPNDPESDSPWVTVVGVIANVKQDGLDARVLPSVFSPETQQTLNQLNFVLRGSGDADSLVASARRAIREVDRQLVLTNVQPLGDILSESTGDERFRTTLLSAFAGMALFLAALGVYGVLAYAVAQRSKELGIRLALGAGRKQLFGMVVRDGMRPVLLGAVVGLAGAVALTRTIKSLLFDVAPLDPATFTLTVAILAAVGILACAIPASRAIRVDPLITLRQE